MKCGSKRATIGLGSRQAGATLVGWGSHPLEIRAFSRRTKDSRGKRPGDTKPEVVEPSDGGKPEPVRRTQIPRYADPRAPAQHATRTISPLPGRPVRRCTKIVVVPAILHPLPHVPVHIVQTPRICGEPTHRRCALGVPPAAATTAIGQVAADVIPPSCTSSSSPHAPACAAHRAAGRPHTPIPTHSTDDTIHPFVSTTTIRTTVHRPNSR